MKKLLSKKEFGHFDLITESGERLLAAKSTPWQEYPRPQMKRSNFQILNGEWLLNEKMTIVPFPPQSRLSGYEGDVGDTLVYTKTFILNDKLDLKYGENGRNSKQERILLHFGAVDQIAKVWLNDVFVGEHEGGYLPFCFDITDALIDGGNELKVEVIDTLSHDYPYGKQKKNRGGMWYTPVSGIWQTVWLERVPSYYIEKIKLTPDLTGVNIELFSNKQDTSVFTIIVTLHNGQVIEKTFAGFQGRVNLSDIKLEDGSVYTPKY